MRRKTDEWEEGYRVKHSQAQFGDSIALGDFVEDVKLILRANDGKKRKKRKKVQHLSPTPEEGDLESGKPGSDFPDEDYHSFEDGDTLPLIRLEHIKSELTTTVLTNAKKAVKRVRKSSESELRQLWVDSDDFSGWEESFGV